MPAAVHYLASNDTTWTPPAVLTLDTETQVIQAYPEVQELRCWHVRADYRLGRQKLSGEHVAGGGTSATDLATRVSKWAQRWAETWIYCHNLSFDLTVTKLPLLLAARGWVTSDMAVDGGSPWMVMHHGSKKLVITDSHAIWPVRLEEIGAWVNIPKPVLPEGDDPAAWMARCAADTDILHTALLEVMDYHDQHQLGRWAITGAAIGWNTMRHLQAARTSKRARQARLSQGLAPIDPGAQPIVIDPDPAGLEHDRLAVYGGRRQTWRHGHLTPGQYIEVDFERAYQTVMAECALPRKRGRWFDSLPIDSRLVDDPGHQWGIIAAVELETATPRWPVRVPVTLEPLPPGAEHDQTGMPPDAKTRIFYPVGRFRTVLAGPDIAEARRLGCLRSIGRGQVHQLGRAIRPWATWSLAAQDDPSTPATVRGALKHQGRAVAGKWAQRSWTKTVIGLSTTYGWSYADAWVNGAGTRGAIIDVAGTKFLSVPDADGDNAYPAVLAWVESYTRVMLGRVVEQLGAAVMVQCDTDGLIIDATPITAAPLAADRGLVAHGQAQAAITAALASVNAVTVPLRLRAKTTYRNLEIIGPQHLTLDGHKRWSGVPGSADRQPDGSYAAMIWPKLAWQMTHGDHRGYTRIVQTYRIAASYAPGWLLADGTVAAPECRQGPDGQPSLVPYSESRYAVPGVPLAAKQPSVLEAIRSGGTDVLNPVDHLPGSSVLQGHRLNRHVPGGVRDRHAQTARGTAARHDHQAAATGR